MTRSGLKPTSLNDDAAAMGAGGRTVLDELLASCVVRRVMEKDGVDAQDIRKLINTVTNARGRSNIQRYRSVNHTQNEVASSATLRAKPFGRASRRVRAALDSRNGKLYCALLMLIGTPYFALLLVSFGPRLLRLLVSLV